MRFKPFFAMFRHGWLKSFLTKSVRQKNSDLVQKPKINCDLVSNVFGLFWFLFFFRFKVNCFEIFLVM